MLGKKDKKILFEVELNWIEKKKGLLSAKDVENYLAVATPPSFGGEGDHWSPEHLFLGAISSCFMTTFLSFADKFDFTISHFACPVIGQLAIEEGKFKFVSVDLYPRIIIPGESFREKANLALEKTNRYCIISNSVNVPLVYHSEILTEESELTKLN